jgi:hypothetical protein
MATGAGMDGGGKSHPQRNSIPGPFRKSLYRLSYLGPPVNAKYYENEGLVVLYTVIDLLLNYCKRKRGTAILATT